MENPVLEPRVFLHIGANKTGTTAIQNFLAGHEDQFLQRGILYPKTGRGRSGAGGDSHIGISTALGFGKPVNVQQPDDLIYTLREEIENSPCTDVVISAEYFILRRDVTRVKQCFQSFDTKIVCYLRRHDRWLEALILQALKTVPNPSWPINSEGYTQHQKATKGQHTDYLEWLTEWAAAFDHQNMIVRPYEEQQNQPNLVADFLLSIGRSDILSEFPAQTTLINKTPPPNAVELMRRIQNCRLPSPLKRLFIQTIDRGSHGNETATFFSPELRRNLISQNEVQYQHIAREFLGRPGGRLFYDPICPEHLRFENLAPPSAIRGLNYLMKGIVQR